MPAVNAHRRACDTLLIYMEDLREQLRLDEKAFWRQVRKDTNIDPNTLLGFRNKTLVIKTHTLDILARYTTQKLRELAGVTGKPPREGSCEET